VDSSPASLTIPSTGLLPVVVLVREHNGSVSNRSGDASDGYSLLRRTSAGESVASVGIRWPSGFQVIGRFAWAELVRELELALDEISGVFGTGFWVEKGVDVAADDVDDVAPETGVFLPDVERLGGGAGSGVLSSSECGLAGGDKVCEVTWGGCLAHHGFVSDDDQLDELPSGPGDNIGDLLLGTPNSAFVLIDEDTNDHLQVDVFVGTGVSDVLESTAVGAVNTNDLESFRLDHGNVFLDSVGSFAESSSVIWSVGDSPLVS